MPLNEEPVEVFYPASDFIHVRKVGSFSETAQQAWKELHASLPAVLEVAGKPTGFFSLYQLDPESVYLAGISVQGEQVDPSLLPSGLSIFAFPGGKYLQFQFTLTGPYDQLPSACGRVFELIKANGVAVASEGRYFMESYANNPDTTPPDELKTHICVPI
eukprot:gene24394-29490_t